MTSLKNKRKSRKEACELAKTFQAKMMSDGNCRLFRISRERDENPGGYWIFGAFLSACLSAISCGEDEDRGGKEDGDERERSRWSQTAREKEIKVGR